MAALQDAGPARQEAEQPRATMRVCGKHPPNGGDNRFAHYWRRPSSPLVEKIFVLACMCISLAPEEDKSWEWRELLSWREMAGQKWLAWFLILKHSVNGQSALTTGSWHVAGICGRAVTHTALPGWGVSRWFIGYTLLTHTAGFRHSLDHLPNPFGGLVASGALRVGIST